MASSLGQKDMDSHCSFAKEVSSPIFYLLSDLDLPTEEFKERRIGFSPSPFEVPCVCVWAFPTLPLVSGSVPRGVQEQHSSQGRKNPVITASPMMCYVLKAAKGNEAKLVLWSCARSGGKERLRERERERRESFSWPVFTEGLCGVRHDARFSAGEENRHGLDICGDQMEYRGRRKAEDRQELLGGAHHLCSC